MKEDRNSLKKGFTSNEREALKEDESFKRTCKKCNTEKYLSKFPSKMNTLTELYYYNHTCSKCCYEKFKETGKENLKKYTKSQKIRESFTIEGRVNMMLNRCNHRAKNYNREFSISKKFLKDIISKGICQKTGINLILDDKPFNPYSPSIDRIDNSKGYTEDNVQVTCMIYNFCKNKFTEEEVEDFFNKIKKSN